MKNTFTLLLLLVLLANCKKSDDAPTPSTTTPPPVVVTPPVIPKDTTFIASYDVTALAAETSFADALKTGTLTDPIYTEVSGIGASQVNTGLFYTEEDSGNPNKIQLVNEQGTTQAIFTLTGFNNRDWEDLAVAPGPVAGTSYVYVADIGDNNAAYPTKFVYRFPEPNIAGKSLPYNQDVVADKIELKLPDGVKNAETLMIDPLTKDIYVVSKGNDATVYVAPYPQSTTAVITMTKIAVLPFDKATAGDISPDGKEVVIKTYGQIFYWKKTGNESISQLLKKTPKTLPYTAEPQGEAICFSVSGKDYYTTSENKGGVLPVIYSYKRK